MVGKRIYEMIKGLSMRMKQRIKEKIKLIQYNYQENIVAVEPPN